MSRTVRVLHILPSVQGYGAERQIMELLKLLRCEQIDPALATVYEPRPEALESLPFRVFSAARKGRGDLGFFRRLIHVIRSAAPQIVHTHTHVGKYWGRMAALAAGVPHIVHTEHNPCDTRRNGAERIADAVLHRATSRVITFFPEQGEILSQNEHLPADKVAVIPNGLHLPPECQISGAARDEAREVLGLHRGQIAIMLVGRMEFQKNHALALHAIAALPQQLRSLCVLAFAGGGRDEEMLRGLARALSIEEQVRFLGYRSDVPKLLQGSDLVLMTSWFEGMPLALIEAMIAGVPIVSTPWTGSANMLGNGRFGFITEGYEPVHVAASIVFAMAHGAMRGDLARRAREHVYRQYGIARMIDAHRSLYLEIVRERAA